MAKYLYILRHAKAETGTASQEDQDRALTERGIAAAQQLGQYFTHTHTTFDHVICSTAVRTRQTWANISEVKAPSSSVEYSEQAYLASAGEWLNIIAHVTPSVQRLLIIGHNPGLHQLALKLAKKGEDAQLDALALHFPTCTLAMISPGDVAWSDIAKSRGELVEYKIPDSL